MEREAPVTDNIKAEVADSYREVVCSGVAALGGVSTLLIHAPNCFFKAACPVKDKHPVLQTLALLHI